MTPGTLVEPPGVEPGKSACKADLQTRCTTPIQPKHPSDKAEYVFQHGFQVHCPTVGRLPHEKAFGLGGRLESNQLFACELTSRWMLWLERVTRIELAGISLEGCVLTIEETPASVGVDQVLC